MRQCMRREPWNTELRHPPWLTFLLWAVGFARQDTAAEILDSMIVFKFGYISAHSSSWAIQFSGWGRYYWPFLAPFSLTSLLINLPLCSDLKVPEAGSLLISVHSLLEVPEWLSMSRVVRGVCWDPLRVSACIKAQEPTPFFPLNFVIGEYDAWISTNLWIPMMGRRANPGSTQQRDTMEMLTHVLSFHH